MANSERPFLTFWLSHLLTFCPKTFSYLRRDAEHASFTKDEYQMRLLIRRALILDPRSPHHKKRLDILIKKGHIVQIGRNLPVRADQVIQSGNLHVSPGWLDIGAQCGEPGYEHREDFQSLTAAAISGGYTAVACFPNTKPTLHSKSEIEYIRNRSAGLPIDVYPIGSVSVDCEGKDLAELRDMHEAGAVAFSDGRKTMLHAGLLLRALMYTKGFNGLVLNRPDDRHISGDGQMHESETSVFLGLKGIPAISEHLMVERDIRLLEYSDSRLHCYAISTAESLAMIRQARRSKLQITASVPAMNLLLEDTHLTEFDTHLKVIPPLRSTADRKAMIRAIKDGTIDCIVSNHEPVEEERKKMEFAYAGFGSTGLEAAFSLANTACQGLVPLDTLINCFSLNPRALLDIPAPVIREKASANLTLFDPDVEWTVQPEFLMSKSKNAAALGQTLTGCVLGVVCNESVHIAPEK